MSMDTITQKHFDKLSSDDAAIRYESFQYIINITNQPVDSAYDVWDDLLFH
jgi:hypothetical protein